jgi:ATP synthase protein I
MSMFRIVGLQILATAIVSLAAWPLGGSAAAISALLGGAACFVPNGMFALRLAIAGRRPRGSSAAAFFAGEFVKVGSTVGLLALIAWAYPDVVWLALIVAVIAALKSYLIAFLWR